MTTVGVEEEFHLVDQVTHYLTPRAPAVLAVLPKNGFTAEAKTSIVETNTVPHTDLAALHEELLRSRSLVVAAAAAHGSAPIAAGTAPLTRLDAALNSDEARYAHLDHTFARLFDEQVICGTHIHVGVEDRDLAAASLAWISPWIPVFLAISANSPYWLGRDTGYASWRTMLWTRWPTAGPSPRCRSAEEYDAMVENLIRTGVISDARMVYHDIRLSSHVPTLELRVCDAVPDADTVVLLTALFRALVSRAANAVHAGREAPHIPETVLRTATWRAARSGLEGDLVDPETWTRARAGKVVSGLVRLLEPELRWYGDWNRVAAAVDTVLGRGSWARVQRSIGRRRGVAAVVNLLAQQTAATPPSASLPPATTRRGRTRSRLSSRPQDVMLPAASACATTRSPGASNQPIEP
ncbi:glutamate--cysteine ligase (plasmid) [Streptomycetaceae bacterium NBC_01309]